MLERLFPRSLEPGYRGHPVAKWVLGALTLLMLWRSCVHIFYADGGAQSIATIPLDTFTANGAAAVVLIFAMWGLSQLLMGAVYALVLLRYQALIPLVWLLFVAEWSGRLAIGLWKPAVETVERAPGATGNLIFPILGLAMLALALRQRPDAAEAPVRAAEPAR
jgi:hypothetical protein